MSLGWLSGVRFFFKKTNDESFHCGIESIEACQDEYGDQVIRVGVYFFPSYGIPVWRFRLQHPSGETGFDSVVVPKLIVDALFDDCHLLIDKSPGLLSYNCFFGLDAINLSDFFSKKGDLPVLVTCCRPSDSFSPLLEELKEVCCDAEKCLRLLFKAAQHCDAVFVWSWAYGLNPVLLSRHPKSIVESLEKRFDPGLLQICKVEAESKLPSW